MRNLDSQNVLDLVFTHTCPRELKTEFIYDVGFFDPTELYLETVFDVVMDINPELQWFFGHFHLDEKIVENFTVVYEDIIEIIS